MPAHRIFPDRNRSFATDGPERETSPSRVGFPCAQEVSRLLHFVTGYGISKYPPPKALIK